MRAVDPMMPAIRARGDAIDYRDVSRDMSPTPQLAMGAKAALDSDTRPRKGIGSMAIFASAAASTSPATSSKTSRARSHVP